MSLLLMMGSDTPNPRSLFANNEPGLAIDVGDRYGASESKRTWRRNLLTYSDQYSNAIWGKEAVTVSANTETAPSGALADTIVEDGTTARHRLSQGSVTYTAGTVYTISVEVKLGTGTRFLIINANTAFGAMASFNLSTGAVHSTTSGTPAIQSLGGGWYRCSVTGTATATGTSTVYLQLDNDGTDGTYLGDSASSIVFGGSQIEVGSLSTYQPITDFSTEFKAAYPTHSLYQDSNGVTPAVSPGDPVGLILDTAKGGLDQLGSELVTNGQFGTDTTGWSNSGGTFTAANGVATKDHSVTGYATFPFTTVVGRFYQMSGTLKSGSTSASSFMAIRKADNTNATTNAVNCVSSGTSPLASDASQTIIFQATATTTYAIVQGNGVHSVIVDNISVREIPGNHAYQTTSGSRPLLARTPDGGRRNLLTYSEQFDNAAWTAGAASVSANTSATTDPVGTNTADKLIENTANTRHEVYRSNTLTAENYTFSIYLKAAERNRAALSLATAGNTVGAVFDLTSSGSVVATDAGASAAISSVGSGWYRCSVTVLGTAAAYFPAVRLVSSGTTQIYTGDGTSGVYLWGAQLETGSSATAYQKVGLTSDVTESGKRDCWGLLFDGSDDSLSTASIDFSAIDKMTVMAGVRKLSDAAIGMIAELTASANSNNGAFYLRGPGVIGANYYFASGGTALNQTGTPENYAAPITNVISCSADISAPLCRGRFNGVQVINSTSSQGSGNFANAILYIGSRAGSSLRFNGILYTLIVRGATTPTGTIADFERNLLARRAGVVL